MKVKKGESEEKRKKKIKEGRRKVMILIIVTFKTDNDACRGICNEKFFCFIFTSPFLVFFSFDFYLKSHALVHFLYSYDQNNFRHPYLSKSVFLKLLIFK